MKVESTLVQKHNDKTNKEEWALISKHSGRVLKWFGSAKPSKEEVAKEEHRIQYFKHLHGFIDERFKVKRADYEQMGGFPTVKFPIVQGKKIK